MVEFDLFHCLPWVNLDMVSLFIRVRLDLYLYFHLFRDKDEDSSDLQDLIMSFSGLGEKVLEHYTFAKVLVFHLV